MEKYYEKREAIWKKERKMGKIRALVDRIRIIES